VENNEETKPIKINNAQTFYTNGMEIQFSIYYFRCIFKYNSGLSFDQLAVTMGPELAKAFGTALVNSALDYEAQFGKIPEMKALEDTKKKKYLQ